jgi:hypothetical protein
MRKWKYLAAVFGNFYSAVFGKNSAGVHNIADKQETMVNYSLKI